MLKIGKRYPTWKLQNRGYVWKFQTKGLLDVYDGEEERIIYDQTSGRIVYKEEILKRKRKSRNIADLMNKGWQRKAVYVGCIILGKGKWRIFYDCESQNILKVYKDTPVPACN